MSTASPLETEHVTLDLGEHTLTLEQVAGLDRLARESVIQGTDEPYWAYLWPSAKALARWVATVGPHHEKRVLDLGCGLGAVGIAAAVSGATVVLADIQAPALVLAERNAGHNDVEVQTLELDFHAPPADLGVFDYIVAADVLYADGMLRGVLRFIKRHLAGDGVAFIADPMRVAPGGVAGACMLHGMKVESEVLVDGQTMTGGVTLHRLSRKRRRS